MTTETHDATTGELVPAAAHVNPLDALLAKVGATGIKQITRTVLQQRDGVPFAVRFEGGAYQGEELQNGRGNGVKMAPARMANVVNLATGEKQVLIMNTVLEGELVRNFGKTKLNGKDPAEGDATAIDKAKGMTLSGSYIGRSFVIGSQVPADAEGKRKNYRVYQIAELEFDGEGETAENVVATETVATGADPVARDGKSKPKG